MGRIIPFDGSFRQERRNASIFMLPARFPRIAGLGRPAIIGPRNAPPARPASRHRGIDQRSALAWSRLAES
jgi:hypothetical protein